MDTRVSDEGDTTRRRRRCASCDKRFTTYERAELTFPAIVKIALLLAVKVPFN